MIHVNKALSAIKKLELLAKYEQAQREFDENPTSIRLLNKARKRAEATRTGTATPESTTNPESTTTTQSKTTSTTGAETPTTLSELGSTRQTCARRFCAPVTRFSLRTR